MVEKHKKNRRLKKKQSKGIFDDIFALLLHFNEYTLRIIFIVGDKD